MEDNRHMQRQFARTCLLSVIVAAFNAADNITDAVRSLFDQGLDSDEMEIILVNDGSTDATLERCNRLSDAYPNIRVLSQENKGVSAARNYGIDNSSGRYIAFVDSDDSLDSGTLEAAVKFFDAHSEEIDLVTYPMRITDETGKSRPHVRERILASEGVYDLSKLQNAFALVTNVNVLVKNSIDLPRFDERIKVHEDLRFNLEILLRKERVGFSATGAYRYKLHSGSAIDTVMHPLYSFESSIRLWEELFGRYPGRPPIYLQASFLNEFNWKSKRDLIYPYHLQGTDYVKAVGRIRSLLGRVDDDIVSIAPRMDEYDRSYVWSLQAQKECLTCSVEASGIRLMRGNRMLLCRRSVVLHVLKIDAASDFLRIRGCLQSAAFEFTDKPVLYQVSNKGASSKVPLMPSSLGYRAYHFQISKSYDFCVDIPWEDGVAEYRFEVEIDGSRLVADMSFSHQSHLSPANGVASFSTERHLIRVGASGNTLIVDGDASWIRRAFARGENARSVFKVSPKAALVRALCVIGAYPPIWLYSDRANVGLDNGYYQFCHDIRKADGVLRFYVSEDPPDATAAKYAGLSKSQIVRRGSLKHKLLFLRANLILCAYIERENWCPVGTLLLKRVCDISKRKVVYLQHGILHAHMPWKYSADRRLVDGVVVSTAFEMQNFVNVYGYDRSQLIPSGMPRYDYIDSECESSNRILFAPSWRKCLVAEEPNLTWRAKPTVFETSSFWRETKAFLSSPDLSEWLESNDYFVDIKLHPIFEVYGELFGSLETNRIRVCSTLEQSKYALCITDYSSIVFDFVYQGVPVVYFFPDELEFKAGLNGYRELDLPLEKGFGPICRSAEGLLEELLGDSESKCCRKKIDKEGFFLYYDNDQADRLYEHLLALSQDTSRERSEGGKGEQL